MDTKKLLTGNQVNAVRSIIAHMELYRDSLRRISGTVSLDSFVSINLSDAHNRLAEVQQKLSSAAGLRWPPPPPSTL